MTVAQKISEQIQLINNSEVDIDQSELDQVMEDNLPGWSIWTASNSYSSIPFPERKLIFEKEGRKFVATSEFFGVSVSGFGPLQNELEYVLNKVPVKQEEVDYQELVVDKVFGLPR